MSLDNIEKLSIKSLDRNIQDGLLFVLIVKNVLLTRYIYIDSVEKLSKICWKIYKSRCDDGRYTDIRGWANEWTEETGLECYFFLSGVDISLECVERINL